MRKKNNEELVRVSIRLPLKLENQIKRICKKNGITLSQYCRHKIEKHIDDEIFELSQTKQTNAINGHTNTKIKMIENRIDSLENNINLRTSTLLSHIVSCHQLIEILLKTTVPELYDDK